MRTDSNLHHPSVLTLAVTFCGGLIALHLAVTLFAPQWLPLVPGYRSLVWRLQLVIAVATLLYLVLRRGEGDFRALFIVALALFAAAEGLGVLARWYGFLALNELAKPFNVALFIFSSLGLSAAIADRMWQGRRGSKRSPSTPQLEFSSTDEEETEEAEGPVLPRHHFALVFATTGFLFLSSMRGAMEMRGHELNDKANVLISAALAAAALCVGAALFKAEVLSDADASGGPAQAPAVRAKTDSQGESHAPTGTDEPEDSAR